MTFAADVLNPDGRVVQQPSTHLLSQAFSKAFNVTYKDQTGTEQYAWITCYGPAISRIFASVVIVHGDDKGLRFPWAIAPLQMVIVPISDDPKLLAKATELKEKLAKLGSIEIDTTEKSAGEKFNYWEMKGVPIRFDLGLKDIADKQVTVFRRDTNKKEVIAEKSLLKTIESIIDSFDHTLTKQADHLFDSRIQDAPSVSALKKTIESGSIGRCMFCSTTSSGHACAEKIEQAVGATVRGTRLEEESAQGSCIVCGKKAHAVVYVARQY